ncbi:MAG: pyruvate kinase [Leptospirales bacterium]|nr:pyruvate kinase [Leptospirales bacterium]HMU82988.1 pyruvate kinase [Leptospiraceae bacterium]HMW59809.1 pyruvate kinase [Leptospiraceae bacterium]HNJ32596.1 pyruvate kinase [Leptospiraceae bacterium]HNL00805.1 pyruvate kinase [Leptospiraceae bacterium]
MNRAKLTKIIATLGPASSSEDAIRSLIRAGADCFRLNFSHADGPAMQPLIDRVRAVSQSEGVPIAILADIQGPKLRIGKLADEGVLLVEGKTFTITTREITGTDQIVHSPYEFLTRDVKPGSRLLLADGTIELLVENVTSTDVNARIVRGGQLFSNKGLNLPGTHLSVETLTEKDRKDLAYIAATDIDVVAISFVRRAEDIHKARECLGSSRIPIMAKLERPEALQNIEDILRAADGIMIARGDLGVEVEFERVPFIQKEILHRAAQRGKWAIVATEMLRSMVRANRPSRAEVTDVANAVLDGTDAVMLSEETAVGQHPSLVVEAMLRITKEAGEHQNIEKPSFEADMVSFSAGAAGAAVSAAERLRARAIIVLAGSNLTALLLSKWRSKIPILALASGLPTLRRLNVLRGVTPVSIRDNSEMDEQIAEADRYLVEHGFATPGETVVVVAALPLGEGKETNSIRFHRVRATPSPWQ